MVYGQTRQLGMVIGYGPDATEYVKLLENEEIWDTFTNGIDGATAKGTASGDLLINKSYNFKNQTNLNCSYGIRLDNTKEISNLYMSRNDDTRCWLTELAAYDSCCAIYGGSSGAGITVGVVDEKVLAIRPVVALPIDTDVEKVNGVWKVKKDSPSGSLYSQITASNFGDYVDYPVDLNGDGNTKNDWRIFYKNNEENTNNVFLIAADHVDWSKNILNTDAMQSSSNIPYQVFWSKDNLEKALTSLNASKYMYNQMTQLKTSNSNFKAVSNLLNTSYWTNMVNTTYATSAIGSPTIEMFMNSWNEKFSGDTNYSTLNCKYDYASSGSGYYVGTGTGIPTTTFTSVTGYNKTGADLYWPHTDTVTISGNKIEGYWLSSPSANDSDFMRCTQCTL